VLSGGDNDAVSSKPITGRDMVDATILNLSCCVSKCGSKKCKTCDHIIEGDTFISNITNKRYKVISPNGCMSCGTKNVIYLMACRKCGVQYVGETSQTIRWYTLHLWSAIRSLMTLNYSKCKIMLLLCKHHSLPPLFLESEKM